MSRCLYKIITEDGTFLTGNLGKLLTKYKQIGVEDTKHLRSELIGKPILSGLLGPFYDGVENGFTIIRYESQSVYDCLC